ncbi:MAG: polysaccharide deacetylase family protein [Acidobacteriaceae bacterium]|nr:polysaccharide deacetylase family protein [Acidobacteriaceae bacterium]
MRVSNPSRRAVLSGVAGVAAGAAAGRKRVVLTFDDAVKSHRTFVGPYLRDLGFRATFFVTHRWMAQTEHFLSWQDAAELHGMGFEIGNHSWTHLDASSPRGAARLEAELALVEYELRRVGVPKPVSFAWPGNQFGPEAVAVLRRHGIEWARRGAQPEAEYGRMVVGPAYDPGKHHRLLIPTTGDAYPDWTFAHFERVMRAAGEGETVVLQFHGVPDVVHPWVHTPADSFRRYMEYLQREGYETLALRDAGGRGEVDDPRLRERYRPPKDGKLALPVEVEQTRARLPYWRGVMAEHGFSAGETGLVTGQEETGAKGGAPAGLALRPYPGGRHPRIGFLDGMVAPMRGTKASVFLPWAGAGYVIVDVPEAVMANGKIHFLGHTHIPTVWDERNQVVANRDWTVGEDGSLRNEWVLGDGVKIGATVRLEGGEVRMTCRVENGTAETLREMRAQVCVMFRNAPGFTAQTNDNKTLGERVATVRAGERAIHVEWTPVQRVWGNPRCPCMHSDPRFPDCRPGEAVEAQGRMWFSGE